MFTPAQADILFNLLIVVFILFGLAGIFWRWRVRNTPARDSADTHASLIIAMYSLGTKLNKVSDGMLGSYPYHLMITEPDVREAFLQGVSSNDTRKEYVTGAWLAGRAIMIVDLPFTSPVHFAGFGLQDKSFGQALSNTSVDNSMNQVKLEGDFPDYFRLYCQPGREIELREVLDPATMEFLADYCKRMQWELLDNSIYFAQSSSGRVVHDSESIVSDAQDFTTRVLPILQRMGPVESRFKATP